MTYNLCYMFTFHRKQIMKDIDDLIQRHYGSYNELIQLTQQELIDIKKVIISKQQQETLANAGLM